MWQDKPSPPPPPSPFFLHLFYFWKAPPYDGVHFQCEKKFFQSFAQISGSSPANLCLLILGEKCLHEHRASRTSPFTMLSDTGEAAETLRHVRYKTVVEES